jgi:hypothetical protein
MVKLGLSLTKKSMFLSTLKKINLRQVGFSKVLLVVNQLVWARLIPKKSLPCSSCWNLLKIKRMSSIQSSWKSGPRKKSQSSLTS